MVVVRDGTVEVGVHIGVVVLVGVRAVVRLSADCSFAPSENHAGSNFAARTSAPNTTGTTSQARFPEGLEGCEPGAGGGA